MSAVYTQSCRQQKLHILFKKRKVVFDEYFESRDGVTTRGNVVQEKFRSG